jgi:hypothetical protein
MTVDVHGLEALALQMDQVAATAARDARQIVSKGALNVKTDWRANAQATAGVHARHYPRSIGYDLTTLPVGASAVIGPDKGMRQGALGNLLEYGSVHNPPHNDGGRALLTEEPRFLAAVQALAARLL